MKYPEVKFLVDLMLFDLQGDQRQKMIFTSVHEGFGQRHYFEVNPAKDHCKKCMKLDCLRSTFFLRSRLRAGLYDQRFY